MIAPNDLLPGRSVRWRTFVGIVPNIFAPLPDIAVHVVKAERIRFELPNGRQPFLHSAKAESGVAAIFFSSSAVSTEGPITERRAVAYSLRHSLRRACIRR
jgi:hypothetical protein